MSTRVISGVGWGGGGDKGCWCVGLDNSTTFMCWLSRDSERLKKSGALKAFPGCFTFYRISRPTLRLICLAYCHFFLRVRARGLKLAMYFALGSKLRMHGTNLLTHTSSCCGAQCKPRDSLRLPLYTLNLDQHCRRRRRHLHRRRHHHHRAIMELRHLFTRSGLTHPEVSSVVFPVFFLPSGRYFFIILVYLSLHVVATFFCIAVFCPRLRLYLIP